MSEQQQTEELLPAIPPLATTEVDDILPPAEVESPTTDAYNANVDDVLPKAEIKEEIRVEETPDEIEGLKVELDLNAVKDEEKIESEVHIQVAEEFTVADTHLTTEQLSETPVGTSALIAEAAAAAVAAAGVNVEDSDVTAAALAVKTEEDDEVQAKRNEQRRKRYREKSVEEETGENKINKKSQTHEDQLAARRLKDRQRYANMNPDQRQVYNSKRREQYHRQSENSRHRRRERERARYHSLVPHAAKERNTRRAKLERERYQRLTPDELESKNQKRRERAAKGRQNKPEGGDVDISALGSAGSISLEAPLLTLADPQIIPTPAIPMIQTAILVTPTNYGEDIGSQHDVGLEHQSLDHSGVAVTDNVTESIHLKDEVFVSPVIGGDIVAAAVEAATEAVEKSPIVSI